MKPHKGDNSRPPDARRKFLNTTEYNRQFDFEAEKNVAWFKEHLIFCREHGLISFVYGYRRITGKIPEFMIPRIEQE